MATVTQESIRPVEVLWLRTHLEDAEGWNRENALQAVLMDLSVRGLLEPEGTSGDDGEMTFRPTKDPGDMSDLRAYEIDVREAVKGEDDQREMVNAVYEFDFEEFFVGAGVLEVVEKEEERGLPLIPESWYSYTHSWEEVVATEAYYDVMGWVYERRDELAAGVSDSSVRADMLPWLLAFPDAGFMEDVDMEQAEEFAVDVPDDMDVSEVGGTEAAAVAATTAGACAAASSACAASAAGACAAGGGAAGAAGGI